MHKNILRNSGLVALFAVFGLSAENQESPDLSLVESAYQQEEGYNLDQDLCQVYQSSADKEGIYQTLKTLRGYLASSSGDQKENVITRSRGNSSKEICVEPLEVLRRLVVLGNLTAGRAKITGNTTICGDLEVCGKINAPSLRGARGPRGDQGPDGDKGPTGDQGPDGDKGPTGDQGPTGDCVCCYSDEISFGAVDMYKNNDFSPDGNFLVSNRRVAAWQLSAEGSGPLNMQFQVPRDLDTTENVEVDIHFAIENADVGDGVNIPVRLEGIFVGTCESFARNLCVTQCFTIPCLPDLITPPPPGFRHFVVSFCINPALIMDPGDFGQLTVLLSPFSGCPPGDANEGLVLRVVAATFRYRKLACDNEPVCLLAPSVSCPPEVSVS